MPFQILILLLRISSLYISFWFLVCIVKSYWILFSCRKMSFTESYIVLQEKRSVLITYCYFKVHPIFNAYLHSYQMIFFLKDDTSENSLNHVFELLFLYNAIQMFVDDKKDNSGLEVCTTVLLVSHRKTEYALSERNCLEFSIKIFFF